MVHRVGLMGCGTVAGYGHLPALKANSEFELVSLFDPDETRLHAAQERFEVSGAFTDVEAFFMSGLDAVSITSPAPCHLENLKAAAENGVHVLCEKPLAMVEAEGQEMIDRARKAKIMLFTGFTARFSPVSLRIRDLVREGAIGDVRSLRLIYIWGCHGKYEIGPDGQKVEQARRAGRMDEGGPLVDCGVHDIDLARWWLGSEVVDWTSAGAWVDEYDAPDHVYLNMDHGSGAHTMVEISYSYAHTASEQTYHLSYDLIGTEGVIRWEMERGQLEVRTGAGVATEQFEPGKNFEGMYAAFAAALDQGVAGDMPSGEDGLVATRIARAATEELMSAHPSGAGRGKGKRARRLRKILVGVDFSASSAAAARQALELAGRYDSQILLLHVLHGSAEAPGFHESEKAGRKVLRHMDRAAREMMADFARAHLKKWKKVETRITTGLPADQVVDLAEAEKVDLVVVGTRGHSGLKRFMLGSVADKIIRSCTCPVLSVRDDET